MAQLASGLGSLRYAIYQAMKPAEAEAARERSFANLKLGADVPERENFPVGKEGRVRDRIGAFAGLSGRTVEKIVQVQEAAEADPERFGDLPQIMDEKSVNAAYRALAPWAPASPSYNRRIDWH